MSCELSSLSENLKKSIETILEQLPIPIAMYSPTEQTILNDFFEVVQYYRKVDYKRNELSSHFEEYVRNYQGTNKYLQTPFLWFSLDFCINANLLLNIAKFHAKEFLGYLREFLIRTYQLIRKGTSLFDVDSFESLQYECNKLRKPLTSEQLQLAKFIYSNIGELGYLALNSQRVKAMIRRNMTSNELSENLDHFFKLLDIHFFLLFNQRVFDLERLYIHFKLDQNAKLENIIEFQDPDNTILCTSDFFTVRGSPSTYLGILTSSTQFYNHLETYIQECADEGKIVLHEMTKITMFQRSVSLVLYQPDIGWQNLTPSLWKNIIQKLITKRSEKAYKKPQSFHMTPQFNPIWHYQLFESPSKVINFYCKIPRKYTFNDLLLNPLANSESKFSEEELELFKTLYRNQVFHIGVRSNRLWYEWSLDAYWIKVPRAFTFKQLIHFLYWLPVSELFFSEQDIYIYVRLPSNWISKIRTDLDWRISSVIRHHHPHKFQYRWYDPEKCQWIPPKILKTFQ